MKDKTEKQIRWLWAIGNELFSHFMSEESAITYVEEFTKTQHFLGNKDFIKPKLTKLEWSAQAFDL